MTDHMPYVAWRYGRPRFVPGPRERALGFKGQDLRHPDGAWFSAREAAAFAAQQLRAILDARQACAAGRIASLPTRSALDAPVAPVLRTRLQRQGYVYFLRLLDKVKIGFSEGPLRRANEVIGTLPITIISIAAVKGTMADEKRLHRGLKRFALGGEWFCYCNEVAAVMSACITTGEPIIDGGRYLVSQGDKGASHNGNSMA